MLLGLALAVNCQVYFESAVIFSPTDERPVVERSSCPQPGGVYRLGRRGRLGRSGVAGAESEASSCADSRSLDSARRRLQLLDRGVGVSAGQVLVGQQNRTSAASGCTSTYCSKSRSCRV